MPRRSGRSVTETLARQSGSPRYLGTIISSGSAVSNTTTASPFNATGTHLLSKILLVQPDTNCYILGTKGTGNEASVSATNGIQLFAGERALIQMDDWDNYDALNATETVWDLTMLSVTGTTNLKVWELL